MDEDDSSSEEASVTKPDALVANEEGADTPEGEKQAPVTPLLVKTLVGGSSNGVGPLG